MRRWMVAAVLLASTTGWGQHQTATTTAVREIVQEIQRADYGDDRAALMRLYQSLAVYVDDEKIGSRVRYWRGFARWRRALNGFNDGVARNEIEDDLRMAVVEFEAAYKRDAKFADAKLAAASCLMNLLYIHLKDPGAVEEYSAKFKPLIKDAETLEPENPRLLWVIGAGLWYMPAEKGGGAEAAIATYHRGLKASAAPKTASALDPTWGAPELAMNLAWSYLHKPQPDLDAAEEYAQAALKLVPTWHYLKDILMPQIEEARKKQGPS